MVIILQSDETLTDDNENPGDGIGMDDSDLSLI